MSRLRPSVLAPILHLVDGLSPVLSRRCEAFEKPAYPMFHQPGQDQTALALQPVTLTKERSAHWIVRQVIDVMIMANRAKFAGPAEMPARLKKRITIWLTAAGPWVRGL